MNRDRIITNLEWDARTRMIADMIEPGLSVLEFGAGRRILQTFLPDGQPYTPCDRVARGRGSIICDLNADTLPDFPQHDIAVFGGILEYVDDVPRLIHHLSRVVSIIITSYAVLEFNENNRRGLGWVNDYTASEVLYLFKYAGFEYETAEWWKNQLVYRFTNLRKVVKTRILTKIVEERHG